MRASLALAALATTVAAIDASVWTFDTVSRGPKITPENARLVLAHRLGLSRYHKIGNADEHTLELLNGIHPPLFAAQSASRKLMLVVEGLDDGETSSLCF